jgi:YD repeat-containing protein
LVTQTGTHLVTEIAYDALGNVRSPEAKALLHEKTTVYRYDALGRQIRTEYPAVSVYDASTDTSVTSASINVRTETTRAGLYTEVTYDALGNAVANRDIAGNYSYKVQ